MAKEKNADAQLQLVDENDLWEDAKRGGESYLCVKVERLGETAQRQLVRAFLSARRNGGSGRGRPKDVYLLKDRGYVAKELVFLHFKQGKPWKVAISTLRRRDDCKNKMSKIKDGSWIIYALDYKRAMEAIEKESRGGRLDRVT